MKQQKKKTVSFTIVSKTTKHFVINLTEDVKDLYNENIRFLKDVEEDTNGKTFYVYGSNNKYCLKWSCNPKLSINSMLSLSKYQKHSSQT